jgi:hypothetical protein
MILEVLKDVGNGPEWMYSGLNDTKGREVYEAFLTLLETNSSVVIKFGDDDSLEYRLRPDEDL